MSRLDTAAREMAAHEGPTFDRWRLAMAACVLDPSYVGALVAAGILEAQDS